MSLTADSKPKPLQMVESGVRGGWSFVSGHVKWVVLLALGVVLAVVVGIGLRWWTHPNLFSDNGPYGGAGTKPLERAQFTVGVVQPIGGLGVGHDPTPHTITFSRTPDAHLAQNSARASVELQVCTRHPDSTGLIGIVDGTGIRYCDTLTPIHRGVTMPWPTLGTYIVATVTPEQAGQVRLTGIDFHYSLGRDHWCQRGVDHVTLDMREKVSASSG